MNKFVRYTRRLIFWFERPLRSEEKEIIWNQACAYTRNKIMQELGPIMQVQPFQPTKPPKLPPLTVRQRDQMQKLRATLKPMQEIEPSPVLPAVPFEFHLVDESWLNDTPVVVENEPETEQFPAMSKLLHGGSK